MHVIDSGHISQLKHVCDTFWSYKSTKTGMWYILVIAPHTLILTQVLLYPSMTYTKNMPKSPPPNGLYHKHMEFHLI